MKKGITIIAVLAMMMTLFTVPVSALEPVPPETPNYAFIPNSGEASVSKVDLVNMEEVARYYTEPREPVPPYNWRTSRIAMDADGNAWVLNTGADGTALQGSVVRIQADTADLVTTNTDPASPLPFGTDEAVQIFPVGTNGDMPRAIAIDEDGYIWIGFYRSGALNKYEYLEDGGSGYPVLTAVGKSKENQTEYYFPLFNGENKINYYEMKFDPEGILYISSRNSTPSRPGNPGVWSFDPATGVFQEKWNVDSPYSLLIDPDTGQVYATSYSNQLWIKGTGTETIEGATNLRGMAFDGLGNIWIANTSGGSGGNLIYWYNIADKTSGSITLPVGTTPVGIGKDAAGLMWAVCRTDGVTAGGYIVAFDPATKTFVTDGNVRVGYRPYAYGDFVVPQEPELYRLCGYKLDADTGEGLAGWTIYLKDESGGIIRTTETGEGGKYCFRDLPAGNYTVEEEMQSGWIQVAPEGGSHSVTLPEEPMIFGIERTATRPILQIDPTDGSVSKFFDTNINSFSMNGSNGLAFDSGSNTFYYVTYPNNAELGPADLYRYINGEVSAEKIFDLEKELACADFFGGKYYFIAGGPTIGATDDLYEVTFNGDGSVAVVNEFKDISGSNDFRWTFSGDIAISPDGVIFGVGLDAKTGKQQFFRVDRDGTDFAIIDANIAMPLQLAFGSDGVLYGNNLGDNSFYTVDLTNGDTVKVSTSQSVAPFNDMASGIKYYNFENSKLFDICGQKLDADSGEGLEGWTINLEQWDDTITTPGFVWIDERTTDENGLYCFDELEAGLYRVGEELLDGWVQIAPTAGAFEVALPEGASNCDSDEPVLYNFENAELFNLCGFKYGVNWMDPEATDKPLAGWTITLLDSEDAVVATTTTDSDGHYCFMHLRAGDYTIVESFGDMNGDGFWTFDGKFWRPVFSDAIPVTLPADASICDDMDTAHHNFWNMCYGNETAWMFGNLRFIEDLSLTSNNWGWSQNLGILAGTSPGALLTDQPIYAGAGQGDITKGYLVGFVDVVWNGTAVVVEVSDADGAVLTNQKVWVGNTALPMTTSGKKSPATMTNAPGKLIVDPNVDFTKTAYVAIHFEAYVPCYFPHPESPQ